MHTITQQQIHLFRSVFASRNDVFAVHWEKGTKHGYMPAYQYDPYLYRQHKMGGGSFQNFPDKSYLPLSDEQISKHLNGNQLIGIYPLLHDNTSSFLAADFDDDHWEHECRLFIKNCADHGIPAYLERSRSGAGGHVWIFFEKPYAALKSRQIFLHLLKQNNTISLLDKESSFDRLFPNQDFLSGKGLGNLIALPLFKPAWDQRNSCFIDPTTLEPIPDQWQFLNQIKRVSLETLDQILSKIHNLSSTGFVKETFGKVLIILKNEVIIAKNTLSETLVNFLKDEFNISNSEFYVKQKSGKSTWGIPRFFKIFQETEHNIILPRGGIGKIIRFCREQNIEFDFWDQRKKHALIPFTFQAELRDNQHLAVTNAAKKDFGVIVAPPGSGKTVIGLKNIAEKQQPALILVHRKQLVEQWIERVVSFLGIPKHEIGIIGQGKLKMGAKVTIATIQSLAKVLEKQEGQSLCNSFGTVLIDECHHIPAETFRDTIGRLHCFYLYGLTATPFRKYSDGKLIFLYIGETIAEITPTVDDQTSKVRIIIQETSLDTPFNPKADKFEVLSKILVHDNTRNKLIVNDIKKEIIAGRKIVVLTERREHIEVLAHFLKPFGEIITLSGDDSDTIRKVKWNTLHEGSFQVLITTGQLFGEGTDLQNISCLFLTYPFSFEGKLIQYIGRIQRGELRPVIYDYHDRRVDYLHRMFLKRNVHYRKIAYQSTLFDEPQDETPIKTSIFITETVKIPMEQLEFLYGAFAFTYLLPKENLNLYFEIENDHIRPELEVLKSYFSKIIGKKQVEINIFAEIEYGEIQAQTAFSDDLNQINKAVIDSVKFKFVERQIVEKTPGKTRKYNQLNTDQLQTAPEVSMGIYETGEELLNDLLLQSKYKHARHLRYLADQHEGSILKLRFVLSPFSFLFLLAGVQQYHLVLETLNTEEATYMWHCAKDLTELRTTLNGIERDLGVIRAHGRQYFLDAKPTNFSRILHDYTDDRKGWIVWKDGLEERIL